MDQTKKRRIVRPQKCNFEHLKGVLMQMREIYIERKTDR